MITGELMKGAAMSLMCGDDCEAGLGSPCATIRGCSTSCKSATGLLRWQLLAAGAVTAQCIDCCCRATHALATNSGSFFGSSKSSTPESDIHGYCSPMLAAGTQRAAQPGSIMLTH